MAPFMNHLRVNSHGVVPKLFLLTNSISSSRTGSGTSSAIQSSPASIMKPLRASMIAASLQRMMGSRSKANPRNGEISRVALRSLLQGRKILIVDDNDVNLKVAAFALKKYGADVVCENCGIKAISLLEPPHHFDACFMDIQMPVMDGYATNKYTCMCLPTFHPFFNRSVLFSYAGFTFILFTLPCAGRNDG